jgi:hypothetical protein
MATGRKMEKTIKVWSEEFGRTVVIDRPICINHGCNRGVTPSGPNRWRPVCHICHLRGYQEISLEEGVTPFKTGKCSNQSKHLGFSCPIDYEKAPWVIGSTQIDHIDGNHLNNTLDNVQELCQPCHQEKGRINGDFVTQIHGRT